MASQSVEPLTNDLGSRRRADLAIDARVVGARPQAVAKHAAAGPAEGHKVDAGDLCLVLHREDPTEYRSEVPGVRELNQGGHEAVDRKHAERNTHRFKNPGRLGPGFRADTPPRRQGSEGVALEPGGSAPVGEHSAEHQDLVRPDRWRPDLKRVLEPADITVALRLRSIH